MFEIVNPIHVLTDVSYVREFQVKKLIKEKKDDPGISEYIDMEKELQEVSSFLILSCNVIPHARVATRQIHRINDFTNGCLISSLIFGACCYRFLSLLCYKEPCPAR